MLQRIKASKAKITADKIEKPKKIRQTGEHHAYGFAASKDVVIEVQKEYEGTGGDFKRPPKGTKVIGDHAEISARSVKGPYDEDKRRSVVVGGNVIAHIRSKGVRK